MNNDLILHKINKYKLKLQYGTGDRSIYQQKLDKYEAMIGGGWWWQDSKFKIDTLINTNIPALQTNSLFVSDFKVVYSGADDDTIFKLIKEINKFIKKIKLKNIMSPISIYIIKIIGKPTYYLYISHTRDRKQYVLQELSARGITYDREVNEYHIYDIYDIYNNNKLLNEEDFKQYIYRMFPGFTEDAELHIEKKDNNIYIHSKRNNLTEQTKTNKTITIKRGDAYAKTMKAIIDAVDP